MINVESLYDEVDASGPGLTLGDSCHFALLSHLPSSHFSNLYFLLILDFFFAKLSLLFHPPFKLKGCLFIHHICQFLEQNAKKKTVLACTQAKKIA